MGAVGNIVKSVPVVGDIFSEGEQGNTVTQNSSSTSGIRLGKESDLEKQATGDISGSYNLLKDFLGAGPGIDAINQSNTDQNSFINLLRNINSTGGMPSADDLSQANRYADQIFAPQTTALNQSFDQQNQEAAKLAARLNRPINDPVIQAKLRQEQMRQQSMIDANRTAFTAQEARNQPFQRLQLQGQLAEAQGSLASQAMSNRMQLLNLGNALQSQERNWRLQTAQRYGDSTNSQHSGGGILGGIGALTGVAGSVAGVAGSITGMGGGGGNSIAGAQASPGVSFGGMQSAPAFNGAYQSSYFGNMNGSSPMVPAAPVRASRVTAPNYTGVGSLNYQAPQGNVGAWGSNIFGR